MMCLPQVPPNVQWLLQDVKPRYEDLDRSLSGFHCGINIELERIGIGG